MIRENNYKNKHLCGICELGSLKGRRIWISEVKSSFTLALIYFRYAWRWVFCLPTGDFTIIWAHNGTTSNTLKTMGEIKSECNKNVEHLFILTFTLSQYSICYRVIYFILFRQFKPFPRQFCLQCAVFLFSSFNYWIYHLCRIVFNHCISLNIFNTKLAPSLKINYMPLEF